MMPVLTQQPVKSASSVHSNQTRFGAIGWLILKPGRQLPGFLFVLVFGGDASHFLHGEDGRSPWTRTTKEIKSMFPRQAQE
jgi:hypothetical protein